MQPLCDIDKIIIILYIDINVHDGSGHIEF